MRKKHAAFTLIEMVTVMTIIVILAGLVVAVTGYVNRKAAMTRASSEIETIRLACQNYKADTGGYPQDAKVETVNGKATFTPGNTDKLSPKSHYDPSKPDAEYSKAGKYLYQQLTGDKVGASAEPDGIPDEGEQIYFKDYDQRIVKADRDPTSQKITRVYYFWDPFGYPYGYSTAAMLEEQIYQAEIKAGNTGVKRKTGDSLPGYNLTTFDIWSTSGEKLSIAPTTETDKLNAQAKWLKNW